MSYPLQRSHITNSVFKTVKDVEVPQICRANHYMNPNNHHITLKCTKSYGAKIIVLLHDKNKL